MNAIELAVFSSRIESVCTEMGAVLRRAAFSPNIKDRLDFSCAIFDANGELLAQAAHIPVHLGSMAYAMRDIVGAVRWQAGDILVLNDPYRGGTHLPDVTVVSPLFVGSELLAFVVNRAHHANIGADSPGSMPISRALHEEGVVIAPQFLKRSGVLQEKTLAVLASILGDGDIDGDGDEERLTTEESGTGRERFENSVVLGDFLAQMSANEAGVARLSEVIQASQVQQFEQGVAELNRYARKLAGERLKVLPRGVFRGEDVMDSDGVGASNIVLKLCLEIGPDRMTFDFSGTSDQVEGNINCPLSVTAAAVYYVVRCLMPDYAPSCAGLYHFIEIKAPKGCLLNALPPAAVAAGNVETSSRVVDLILATLQSVLPERIPAASQGTMNNVAMGGRLPGGGRWDYYETLAGGVGAHRLGAGLDAVHSHMTNTLNTPIESVELHYPLRIERYGIRRDSRGAGLWAGGAGIDRSYVFLAPAEVTLLTERRATAPKGVNGGQDGAPGSNRINGVPVADKGRFELGIGDLLTIQTPGGGGWGDKD
ncbi:MAG: hydantoinase B/oxoprolinase family protein [Pseudomonadales bacterium]|nr:hydantoinase B/oxoprolinase family protein [Pseudomonadales bacterium]